MSRRRVSVKDLGDVDCQGWMLRRKEGRRFMASRWKRYWFVLKKTSLYWYKDKTAQAAEGFMNLSGFSVQQDKLSRRKHIIMASHPDVVTVSMATESVSDMNRWISKLTAASHFCDITTEERYSEDSDQDEDECPSSFLDSQLDPENRDANESSSDVSTSGTRTGHISDTETRQRPEPEDWTDVPSHVSDDGDGGVEKPSDEMESLYVHLKAAKLSLIERSRYTDFRTSFIHRCQNQKVNENLHLVRILQSTLKDKESTLQVLNQILDNPCLTASTFRTWKMSNVLLLQESRRHRRGQRPQRAVGGTFQHVQKTTL